MRASARLGFLSTHVWAAGSSFTRVSAQKTGTGRPSDSTTRIWLAECRVQSGHPKADAQSNLLARYGRMHNCMHIKIKRGRS